MKAVILAAGKGSRLPAVTESTPKSLILVQGKPILVHNLELCARYGITDIFINTHHLAAKITSALGDGSRYGVNIHYSFESILLGTAGALVNFRDGLKDDRFYVLYGDNFSNYHLGKLREKLERHEALSVIGFHSREDTASSGVAEFDQEGRILRFIEKPKPGETTSHWVNAGIYYLSPEIFNFIPHGYSDFAIDIFPALLQKNIPLYGVCENTDVAAFDTPEMYEASLRRWK